MLRYKITFKGRENTAIGIFYRITEELEAANEAEAINKLYEKYEHITIENIEAERIDYFI